MNEIHALMVHANHDERWVRERADAMAAHRRELPRRRRREWRRSRLSV